MAAFTYGTPDGTQILRPTHRDDRFEMLNTDSVKRYPLPIAHRGMKLANAVAVGKPPTRLEDGIFLSLATKAAVDDSGYGPNAFRPAGAPAGSSIAHGLTFYDVAASAAGAPVYMTFSANTSVISNSSNSYFIKDADGVDTATKNPNYAPGEFISENVTGVLGTFRAWMPARLTSELSLGGYTAGDQLSILNGKIAKAVVGDMVIGRVEIKDTLKMLCVFDLSNPHKLQA